MRRIRGIRIIYEDDVLIVIEKSAGILTCATRRGNEYTVEDALGDYVRKGQLRSRKRVYLVHRLDRDTSGVMMVAKNETTMEYFRSRWNEITEKTYLARIEGKLDSEEGAFESYLAEDANMFVRSVTDPSKGKFARTEWKRISETDNTTLVKVFLKSGRKNQIRVHFREAGHPIVGDAKYNSLARGKDGLCLHSWKLAFVHPNGKRLEFESPMPSFAMTKGVVHEIKKVDR